MKNSFLLPLRLIITLVIFLLILFAAVFLYFTVIEHSADQNLDENWISLRLTTALTLSIFPAALLTILTSYFIILKYPGNQLITLAVFLLSVFALLHGANAISNRFGKTPESSLISPVPEKTILNYKDDAVYITEKNGNNVTGIMRLDKKSAQPMLNTYSNGIIIAETGMLQVDENTIILDPANPNVTAIIHVPVFLSNVIRDIRTAKLILLSSNRRILLFSIYLCSLWIFSRLSAWPLFNLFLTAGVLRLTLSICHLSNSPFIERVFEARNISAHNMIPTILGCIAGLLFVWDIFFVPYKTHTAEKAA